MSFDPMTPIFVLIDPLLGEPLPSAGEHNTTTDWQREREKLWSRPIAAVELARHVKLAPGLHPYLVELQGPDDPWLATTLELAQAERDQVLSGGLDGEGAAAHRIGAWLQSALQIDRLAAQLSPLMRVNTEAPTRATYLRLADRRVMALLRHVVGDAKVAAQFGRLHSWAYLDLQGRLIVLRSAGEETQSLRLSSSEWAVMNEGEAIARTLAQWLGEVARRAQGGAQEPAAEVARLSAAELYGSARQALAQAEAAARRWPHRFNRLQDRTVWAALSLLYPERLQTAAIVDLMQQTGSAEDPPEPVRYLHTAITQWADHQAVHPEAGDVGT
ncbi:DUF4123 domain-containing protein [Aquabacterium sp. A7-Y]|uniref:DUF4123 domain-containing protein n=1 Tax=Aquabacterium sp. A7-Y TaxID=1349605 RepID=UPI00223E83D5|nr:DUF4123 domain-containing protein [Aquabacterium sp. A7-Y]MCW7537003.1 DUF4123 domain-containing protein [Aquabacterium sp. A7-Y]